MNRREVLELSAIVGAAVVSTAAADTPKSESQPMKVHSHEATGTKYKELITAASACVGTGNLCLTHCVELLGEGDRELAACARTVRDTIAACAALQQLAAANSPHTPDLARVVAKVCSDCEAECHKHEKHSVCRDCEKACHECRQECDKAAA